MMSIRAIARSAPRSVARLSSAILRQPTVARPAATLRSTAWAPLRLPQLTSSFSTTQFRKASAGEVDQELSLKLDSELQYENDLKESEPTPASVKDFLENSPFELIDEPGKEDVILKRKFGNETITVSFSINDLSNYEQEPDVFNEDEALTDEQFNSQSRAAEEAEAEDGAEAGEEGEGAPPCRLNIVVEKDGKGALNIEAVAQEGAILVENFYYYADPKMAHSSNAEISHQAQDAFPGPPFGTLDEDLQILMERYLEERGVTQALAVFVPDYMDLKEQKEYSAWLKNVKDFIDA